jgi:hypothetical protein
MKKLSLLLIPLIFSACYNVHTEDLITEGYVPVYDDPIASEVRLLSSRPIKNPGKIYLYQHFLLVNERDRGIHIFDNTDPANPVPMAFAEILGNSDMAIKNNVLFANHFGNLVALQANNFSTLQKIGELPINSWLLGVPPPSGFYFECVNESVGLVVSWKKQTLTNPKCYAH